jgi:hypothetical protein
MKLNRHRPLTERWRQFALVLIASVVWIGHHHTFHEYGDVDRYDPYFYDRTIGPACDRYCLSID